jgi:hypothetical protein
MSIKKDTIFLLNKYGWSTTPSQIRQFLLMTGKYKDVKLQYISEIKRRNKPQ